MTCIRAWFLRYKFVERGGEVSFGGGEGKEVVGKGVVLVTMPNGANKEIHNILHVPTVINNLLVVNRIADYGFTVDFDVIVLI